MEIYRTARAKCVRDESSDESSDAPIDPVNTCTECGVDLGSGNPRQLCGKTMCLNSQDNIEVVDNIEVNSSHCIDDTIATRVKNRRGADAESLGESLGEASAHDEAEASAEASSDNASWSDAARDHIDEDSLPLVGAGEYGAELLKEMIRDGIPEAAIDEARKFAAGAAQRKVQDREKMMDAVTGKILDTSTLNDKQREEARRVHSIIKRQRPSLENILDLEISDQQKSRLVSKYLSLHNVDPYTDEYNTLCDEINAQVDAYRSGNDCLLPEDIVNSSRSDEDKIKLLDSINNAHSEYDSMQRRALASGLPIGMKLAILNEVKNLQKMTDSDNERATTLKWIDNCLQLPTALVPMPVAPDASPMEMREFEDGVVHQFDRLCFGMKNVKERVIDYLICKVRNQSSVMPVLALIGPPGTGKTNVAECIATIMQRPLVRIKFGGETDAVKLRGNNKSYIGSSPGEIVRALQSAKCRNPVILLDEIDKIGRKDGDGTQEVTSTLIHAVDTYRDNFSDSYIGHDIDLHDVIWVATMNSDRIVDAILMNRMDPIYVEPYCLRDKITISNQFFIPEFTSKMRLPERGVVVPADTMGYIIEYIGSSDGLRPVRKALEMIFARITRLHVTGRIAMPFTITRDFFAHNAETVGLKKRENTPSYFS